MDPLQDAVADMFIGVLFSCGGDPMLSAAMTQGILQQSGMDPCLVVNRLAADIMALRARIAYMVALSMSNPGAVIGLGNGGGGGVMGADIIGGGNLGGGADAAGTLGAGPAPGGNDGGASGPPAAVLALARGARGAGGRAAGQRIGGRAGGVEGLAPAAGGRVRGGRRARGGQQAAGGAAQAEVPTSFVALCEVAHAAATDAGGPPTAAAPLAPAPGPSAATAALAVAALPAAAPPAAAPSSLPIPAGLPNLGLPAAAAPTAAPAAAPSVAAAAAPATPAATTPAAPSSSAAPAAASFSAAAAADPSAAGPSGSREAPGSPVKGLQSAATGARPQGSPGKRPAGEERPSTPNKRRDNSPAPNHLLFGLERPAATGSTTGYSRMRPGEVVVPPPAAVPLPAQLMAQAAAAPPPMAPPAAAPREQATAPPPQAAQAAAALQPAAPAPGQGGNALPALELSYPKHGGESMGAAMFGKLKGWTARFEGGYGQVESSPERCVAVWARGEGCEELDTAAWRINLGTLDSLSDAEKKLAVESPFFPEATIKIVQLSTASPPLELELDKGELVALVKLQTPIYIFEVKLRVTRQVSGQLVVVGQSSAFAEDPHKAMRAAAYKLAKNIGHAGLLQAPAIRAYQKKYHLEPRMAATGTRAVGEMVQDLRTFVFAPQPTAATGAAAAAAGGSGGAQEEEGQEQVPAVSGGESRMSTDG